MAETSIQAAKEEHRYYPYQGIFYLYRDSFWQAGQDSWTEPPAQNPDMFVQLSNVEPVLNGILQRRRGYNLLSQLSPSQPYTLGYSFRSDLLGLRSVVFTNPTTVTAITEGGTSYLNPIFTPSAGATRPRMALSRNFGYFADGVAADNKKWDGTQGVNNLTNWGIGPITGVSGPATATASADEGGGGVTGNAGPLSPGTGSGTGGWAGSSAIAGSVTLSSSTPSGGSYSLSNFGFNIPATATIQGIKVIAYRSGSFECTKGGAPNITDNGVYLTKVAGVAGGGDHSNGTDWISHPGATTYGSSSDLWGRSWMPSDINSSGFGFNIDAKYGGSNLCQAIADINSVTITVYYVFLGPPPSWSGVANVTSCGSSFATASVSTSVTSDLQGSSFGLTPSGVITGIKVTLQASTSGVPISVNPILVKAGVATGIRKSLSVTSSTPTTLTFGSQFDLWGASWLASDISSGTFGFQVNCTTGGGTATVSLNCYQVTVYTETSAVTVGSPSAGSISLLSGRTYFYAFQNSKTGHTSDLGPASVSTGPITSQQIPLSNIPVHPDPQVDTVLILATADGNDETTLYLVTSLANGVTGFTDNITDTVLQTQSLYQYTDAYGNLHGVANNSQPPAMFFPTKHKGRIYGANGSTLYFSKNLDEVTTANGLITAKYEEAWPAFNALDISQYAETIKGLMSDGETLWVGTERSIRRLIGDSPSNFQIPEVQFNEVGLYNQDVWKVTFYEGQPVGTMWLTPDSRVIASDFNTYQDVGWPIQDVLNSVNLSATVGPHACFVSDGPADYYMLYLPTGTNNYPDTVCVYNLRTQKWFIWQPTDQITASVFLVDATGAPRWMFAAQGGNIYEWVYKTIYDRGNLSPVTYPVSIKTSWLNFGDRTLRKALNQALYLGQSLNTSVQVEGAILDTDLDGSAAIVVPMTAVTPGPLGDLFWPLATYPTYHRWYRFTFTDPSGTAQDILDGFSFETAPLFRY